MTEEQKTRYLIKLLKATNEKVVVSILKEFEIEIKYELRKENESKLHQPTVSISVCEHKNEKMHQGDGFVYVTCKDCGEDL